MKKNYFFTLLLTFCMATFSFGQDPVINEIDADSPSTDTEEFIEIKWTASTSLDGYVVVLFNGSGDSSYATYNLNGFSTDANGFFILGTTALANPDIDLGTSNKIQNGADAVAIYKASDTDFPNGTAPTTTNLVSAVVYDTNDSDDSGLLTGLGQTVQYNENENGDKDNQSIQRHSNGTYQIVNKSYRAENNTSSAASLTISSPFDNQVFGPLTTEIPISLDISNFNLSGDNGSEMSDNTGDGYIYGTLTKNGVLDGSQKIFSGSPTQIDSAEPGTTYIITAELVDNNGNSLNPKVEATATFSVASYNDIISISDLRNGTEGSYYKLDGDNVTLTYARSSRNQKYIQDQTGGILIDDSAGIITTAYKTYDILPILTGRLSSFNGILQFVPDKDPGASQFVNQSFEPEVVSLADFVTNFKDYESELIKINNISFDSGDVGNNFASSTSYDISSGTTMSVFRTNFSEADYIGTAIPSGTANMIVLGGSFNDVGQITAINLAGITLGIGDNSILGFATYPNPITNKRFTISSSSSEPKEISIFNVIGKKVFATSFSGVKKDIDVSSINAGVYILKVIEAGKIATKKLVIR